MEISAVEIIGMLVAPAVMISAAGLLAIAASARMMAAFGHLRAVDQERRGLSRRSHVGDRTEQHASSVRLDDLRMQANSLLGCLGWMRFTLVSLFVSVALMVLSSACICAVSISDRFFHGAFASFAVGATVLVIAMGGSAIEFSRMLRAARGRRWGDAAESVLGESVA